MTSRSFDSTSVVRLLERDVVHTVGAQYVTVVHDLAANVHRLALDWMEQNADGDAGGVEEVQARYDLKVVDDVQQYLHDVFLDITWPACPRHPHHPLWFRDGAWWCDADDIALFQLGELPGRQAPSSGADPAR